MSSDPPPPEPWNPLRLEAQVERDLGHLGELKPPGGAPARAELDRVLDAPQHMLTPCLTVWWQRHGEGELGAWLAAQGLDGLAEWLGAPLHPGSRVLREVAPLLLRERREVLEALHTRLTVALAQGSALPLTPDELGALGAIDVDDPDMPVLVQEWFARWLAVHPVPRGMSVHQHTAPLRPELEALEAWWSARAWHRRP